MTPRFSRFHILFVSLWALLIVAGGGAPLGAQTDTLYARRFDDNLIPRFMTSFKAQTTSFITHSGDLYSVDRFSTGGQGFAGIELGYKWATIGYNLGFNRENSTANTDFRFATSYKGLRLQANYTSLRNLSYMRIDGREQKDTLFKFRQHNIALHNVGFKLDYVFNRSRFYYAASLAQSGQQVRSCGSFLVSGGASYQDFDLRNLSDSAGLRFRERYPADRLKTLRVDIGPGYAYNWVANRYLVFHISEIPNLSLQQLSTGNLAGSGSRLGLSFTNYIRAGFTYTRRNAFGGIYVYNTVTTSRWAQYSYNNYYTSVQLHIGLVLGDPKRYLKKM